MFDIVVANSRRGSGEKKCKMNQLSEVGQALTE